MICLILQVVCLFVSVWHWCCCG